MIWAGCSSVKNEALTVISLGCSENYKTSREMPIAYAVSVSRLLSSHLKTAPQLFSFH
jgi:hypothetical protein